MKTKIIEAFMFVTVYRDTRLELTTGTAGMLTSHGMQPENLPFRTNQSCNNPPGSYRLGLGHSVGTGCRESLTNYMSHNLIDLGAWQWNTLFWYVPQRPGLRMFVGDGAYGNCRLKVSGVWFWSWREKKGHTHFTDTLKSIFRRFHLTHYVPEQHLAAFQSDGPLYCCLSIAFFFHSRPLKRLFCSPQSSCKTCLLSRQTGLYTWLSR